jgi:NADH-quinone oxidoreductase subunit G
MALLSGPNSFGGALLADNRPVFDTLMDDVQEGKIKALVCLESDPYSEAMDPSRAQTSLGHLELLVTIDSTPTLAAQRANVFLPSRANAEMAGCYINNEGRLQPFFPVIDPGEPIRDTGQGDHPPREFFAETPGSTPEADWWLLATLLERNTDLSQLRHSIAAADERLAGLAELTPESAGILVKGSGELPPSVEQGLPQALSGDTLQLLAISARVGSHWLAHLSAPLAATESQPYVVLHPELAEERALAEGDKARLTTHFGHCSVTVHTDELVIKDRVLVPQLWGTALEGMIPGSGCECRLDKEVGA